VRTYLLRRFAQAAGVLWAAYTLSFLILDVLPGDAVGAAATAAGGVVAIDPARLAELHTEYGYDEPVLTRYLTALGRAFTGDLGTSVSTGRPVARSIADALPPTIQLTVAALLAAVLLGAGVALLATLSARRWLREWLLSLPPLAASLPSFWVGLVLVQLLSFRLRLFPAFGDTGTAGLVLPVLTLALPAAAVLAQVLARSLLDTLVEPWVTTARAKGVGRTGVVLRHVLKAASLPVLTVLGVVLGQLLAGTVVVETVFSRNGLGRVTAAAVAVRDAPLVQGVVLLGAAVAVTVTLLVDLAYPVLDRRIVLTRRATTA
jgi:peptide/nickel transport system permease protein